MLQHGSYFMPFYGRIIFYFMDIPSVFSHPWVDGHTRFFHPLVSVDRVVMNIHVQIFV